MASEHAPLPAATSGPRPTGARGAGSPLRGLAAVAVLAVLATSVPLRAEVVRVVVERREEVLEGREWGAAGAYEKLSGRILFAFDPTNPANASIVDLDLAVRGADGKVEAWADFMVLQPRDPARRRGVAWVEVSNRGGKASLRYFNRAPSGALDPTTEEELGDGLLLRQGLTLIWVGWQWDVPYRDGLLRLQVPVARNPDGSPIEGLVRSDWTVDEPADVLPLSHRDHRTYPAADAHDPGAVLTVRDGRAHPREVVARHRWRFEARMEGPEAGRLTLVRLEGGFEAGKIYELVYRARDPRVAGLGLAVVRDVLSFARYDLRSPFPVRRGVAFGVSQTGRFLRHFLYQGFNTDEQGRKVYDGMLVHTAGAGRGSFNHRFAQPSRDAHRYSAFFYPTDLFPFAGRSQTDPLTGRTDGLLEGTRPEHRPLVFYTNTGYEYWGRAASLIHTTPDGTADVPPLDTERIYHLSGGQHSPGTFPPPAGSEMDGGRAWRGNPVDFLLVLRALAVRLVASIDGTGEPPPSAFPRLADGSLVSPEGLAFPPIPGVEPPRVVHEAYRADYGPRWREGIVDRQPPALGPAFPSLVPQVDGLGNEIAGVRPVELRVPLATYAPWHLRTGFPGGNGELADFVGTYAPLPRSRSEATGSGDPRPSVSDLYPSREGYLARVRGAAEEMAGAGYLLWEDVDAVVERSAAQWDWLFRLP